MMSKDVIMALKWLTIDSDLKFNKLISFICHKDHARANLILRYFSSCDRMPLVKAFSTSETYIHPLLEYWTLVCIVGQIPD